MGEWGGQSGRRGPPELAPRRPSRGVAGLRQQREVDSPSWDEPAPPHCATPSGRRSGGRARISQVRHRGPVCGRVFGYNLWRRPAAPGASLRRLGCREHNRKPNAPALGTPWELPPEKRELRPPPEASTAPRGSCRPDLLPTVLDPVRVSAMAACLGFQSTAPVHQ